MLRNYFKIAIRNLLRNQVYTFINIAGLSLGIAASMLIGLWVIDEVSYNRFHSNYDRINQVWFFGNLNGEIGSWRELPFLLYEDLKTNHKKIRNAAITDLGGAHLLTVNEKRVSQKGLFVSPEFLEMFRFKLMKGAAEKVLDDPLSIVLTESTAKSLFGDQDPINKIVRIDNGSDVKVTGVLKDIPLNSSIRFDYLLTFALFQNTVPWVKDEIDKWYGDSFQIFAELQPGAERRDVNKEIKNVLQNKDDRFISKEAFLYPMDRWNLHGSFVNGKETDIDRSDYVRGFSFLALGILAIACINFMNLSTARSERRAREVGIRKIVGSQRKQLIYQFIGESVFLSFIAFLLAIALVELSLPFYNYLIDKKLFIQYSSPLFWLLGFGLVLITGLLSGSYPAFYLSSFSPAKVLKGQLYVGQNGILPRKTLVVIQFSFSILLIVATVVVYQQMEYARSRQLGYNKQNLITVSNNEELQKNYAVVKKELIRTRAAAAVTRTSSPITAPNGRQYVNWPGNQGQSVVMTNIYADYDYVKTMGMKLIEGRDFSEEIKGDTTAVLLNLTAIDIMGMKNPLGREITTGGIGEFYGRPLKIIGVMEDVLMNSPFETIRPMYVELETDWTYKDDRKCVTVRLENSGNLSDQLKKVELVFKKFNPSYPFQFTFVDDDFNKKFNDINLIQKLTNVFAFLAIAIAGLGLFGLAAFTVERRTKEFGVRRILGATMVNLIELISRDFAKLIVIAFVIACTVSWFGVNRFLEHYPYHISFDWRILPAAGFVALSLTFMIVLSQALRASATSPSGSLRSE